VKYTHSDLAQFQQCVRFDGGRFEIWFGCDEALLAGYALGACGAVGSTYNFAAPLYHEMIAAYDARDPAAARSLQAKSIQLIRACQRYGFAAAAKAVMSMLGIDCGPVRSPLRNLTAAEVAELAALVTPLDVLRRGA
jgi:N-acetylneuraminate lyase